MEFKPLYYRERMMLLNPLGDVGIVTLWAKVEAVTRVLTGAGVDLVPQTSRVAVIANLYGNGLPHMLRTLLYNPQIAHLVVLGPNLSGSREWLVNFFEQGLEETVFLGAPSFRIVGTNRGIDGGVTPDQFIHTPCVRCFGEKLGDGLIGQEIRYYLESLPLPIVGEFQRVDPSPIPEPKITRSPSNPGAHLIHRRTQDEAWRELVFRIYRFGYRQTVMKSTGPEVRIELLNTHVVVDDPREESEEVLARSGFNLTKLREYGVRMLDPSVPTQGLNYTYGWLMRTGLEDEVVDSLEIVSERLKRDSDSRHAYFALWNNTRHLPSGSHCPCFVTGFFRRFDGRLTFTATFRVHNAMDAWPENFYGLAAIQRFVAERAGMEIGPLTVISHSISIDPSQLEKAKRIADERTTDDTVDPSTGKHELRFDPNGAFTVTIDQNSWELVVQHSFEGATIQEYRGKSAEEIERKLARDCAVSVISHALYLGREVALKEQEMRLLQGKSRN